MGQMTETFLDDHLTISNLSEILTRCLRTCCAVCKISLKYSKYFLSYGRLNVATVVVFHLQNWHRFIFFHF